MIAGLRLADSLDDTALLYLATVQAIAYGAATRLWVKGRSKGMLFIDLVIAVVGAWLVTGHFLRQTRPTET